MANVHVLKALIEAILFFEFADEESIHPDAAVKAVEQVAAHLQQMDKDSKIQLASEICALARDYPEYEAFVRDIPNTFGMI